MDSLNVFKMNRICANLNYDFELVASFASVLKDIPCIFLSVLVI